MKRQRASAFADTQYFATLKWSAKDGSIEFKSGAQNAEWEEMSLPLHLILDAAQFRTGWRKLKKGDVDHLYHPDRGAGFYPPEPDANHRIAEKKPWSRVMSFLATGRALNDEITELSLGSMLAMTAFDDLVAAFWQAGGDLTKAAKIRLTDKTKVRTSHGDYYAPVLELVEVAERDEWFAGKDVCGPDKLWIGNVSQPETPQPETPQPETPQPADAAPWDEPEPKTEAKTNYVTTNPF